MPDPTLEQREAALRAMEIEEDKYVIFGNVGLRRTHLEALIAAGWGPRKQWGYAEHYPLDACIWKRASTDEWVLEIEGEINETSLACRHPQPSRLLPEDVPGLPERYVDREAEARGYRAGVEDAARECRRAAAEILQGQVRPGQPRRVVTRPMARMAIRCAQRIRALADKPKETPHG